ncbi:DUF4124 domain-containing protein [Rhodanobacter sp. C01]|uniref:DUF4124 domain-containing protein n=1 Tax=Rhodanobacter sp. C01 TaxID=1945856 RepID=UPI0009CFCD24|nr:DUF4124 domain-containing protein [Rhodanobacter sp. C01]OOG48106.1 DUF4124 domain-containing protein [Rhodanobacter sp. C01]
MHRSLIAVALLLLAPLATAQVYKWTDASGTVHYSQDAPPQGTKYKQVKTVGSAEPLSAPAAASAPESSSQTAAAAPPAADTSGNQSTFCVSLRANLAALQGSAPVVMKQPDGKTTALDDDQRKQQASSAQTQYDQYCQSK